MTALVNQDQLMEWTAFKQRGALEVWLKKNRVNYTYGKGNKIITTLAAINKALLGEAVSNEEENDFT